MRSANAGIPAPHNNIPRTWCMAMTGMVAREDRKVPGHWNDAPVTLDLGRDQHLTSLRLPQRAVGKLRIAEMGLGDSASSSVFISWAREVLRGGT